MQERIHPELEKIQRDVSSTAQHFHELQERKTRLLEQMQERTEAEGIGTSDAKETLLEDLQHTLRVEYRYSRMLLEKVNKGLDLIADERQRLARISVESGDRYKTPLLNCFDTIAACTKEMRSLLQEVMNRIDREIALVRKSEGR